MCVVYVSDSEELLPKSSRCLYIFFFCITDPLHSTLQCYCVQRAIFKMKKKKEEVCALPKNGEELATRLVAIKLMQLFVLAAAKDCSFCYYLLLSGTKFWDR